MKDEIRPLVEQTFRYNMKIIETGRADHFCRNLFRQRYENVCPSSLWNMYQKQFRNNEGILHHLLIHHLRIHHRERCRLDGDDNSSLWSIPRGCYGPKTGVVLLKVPRQARRRTRPVTLRPAAPAPARRTTLTGPKGSRERRDRRPRPLARRDPPARQATSPRRSLSTGFEPSAISGGQFSSDRRARRSGDAEVSTSILGWASAPTRGRGERRSLQGCLRADVLGHERGVLAQPVA